jgi:hypothetical protein
MENNFLYTEENFLSKDNCDFIINYFKNKTEKETSKNGINYAYFLEKDYINLFFLKEKIDNIMLKYVNTYPQLNFVGKYAYTEFRFKHIKPNNFFKNWHSEHNIEAPNRILCMQIYLSDHNCGTEFYNNQTILSKKGKVVIFPSFFTHTHRGQICPELKDRYILGGYCNFIK